jgi:hypothetical protein
MEIIELLTTSAELLGLNEEVEALKSANEENESGILFQYQEVERLYRLLQFSLQEIASNYIPIYAEYNVHNASNCPISDLENYIRIKGVYRGDVAVDYRVINRNINFELGSYTIKYYTYPKITSMFDDIDFLSKFSPDVLVFGTCAYYSLAKGMFKEFEEFHDKYLNCAESIKCVNTFSLPKRRWE